MAWFSHIAHLMNQRNERYLPTAFDNTLSIVEKLNMAIEYLNVVIETTNTIGDYVDENVTTQHKNIKDLRDEFEKLKYWLENEGLEERTIQVLNAWFDSGKLGQIINQEVFGDKLNKGEVSVNDIDKNKGLFDQTWFSDAFLSQMTGNTPINATPANDSVTLEKLAIRTKRVNLFNKATVKNNVFLNGATGAEMVSADFKTSDFIAVIPNTIYTVYSLRGLVYYNAEKVVIGSKPDTAPQTNYSFTTPVNAAFIRFYWYTELTVDQQQLNLGNVALKYSEYAGLIDRKYVEKPIIDLSDLSFAVKSSNLFNKAKASMNTTLTNTSGVVSTANNFAVSELIEIKPNTPYTIKDVRAFAFYTELGAFISGSPDTIQKTNHTVTPPANAKYIRFSWYLVNVSVDVQQMNEGSSLLAYKDFGYFIPQDTLFSETGSTDGDSNKAIMVLPPKIHAVVGKEINVYFDNLINIPTDGFRYVVTCSIGKQLSEKWNATPTQAGTFGLTIGAYKDGLLVAQGSTNVIVKVVTVGTGVSRNAIIMGDSTINQEYSLIQAKNLLSADPLTVNFLGTRGVTAKHEGRGGWSGAMYRQNQLYLGQGNPFYNPATSDFDFSYYMENQGYATPSYFAICLGINDVFGYKDDASLLAKANSIISDFNFIISKVREFNQAIKIGIYVTIPPNASQDAFGEAYGNSQTQWRYKRNNALFINELVKHYTPKESNQIYLIADNSNIDTKNGFRDGVHPNETIGDKQRGDTLYYWLKSFEV